MSKIKYCLSTECPFEDCLHHISKVRRPYYITDFESYHFKCERFKKWEQEQSKELNND